MSDDTFAILRDYESTVGELREAVARLTVDMEILVDWCDRLRTANLSILTERNQHADNSKMLLQTIDILRSENERLKIALQTGEQ
jgi:hypothetical protein